MNFPNPLFLLGAFAAAIQPAIHLIKMRCPRNIAFPPLALAPARPFLSPTLSGAASSDQPKAMASGDKKYAVTVNQNIMESNFSTLSPKDLDNLFNNSVTMVNMIAAGAYSEHGIKQQLKSANFGEEIWSWFIRAALLFLITETLLSKTYKAETIL